MRATLDPTLTPRRDPAEKIAVGRMMRDAMPVLGLVAAVIGGMYAGVVTPTEASAFGSLLALILAVAYRELTWPKLWLALRNTVLTSAVIMFITINAQVLNFAVVSSGIGRGLADWLVAVDVSPFLMFCLLLAIYAVIGMFIDGLSIMLLTVPLLYPTLMALGFNGVWVGVILVVFIELGALTPPMGLNLFAISSIAPDKTSGRDRLGFGALRHADRGVFLPALCRPGAGAVAARRTQVSARSTADVCPSAAGRTAPSSPGCLTNSGDPSRPRNGICISRASCRPIRCSRVRPSIARAISTASTSPGAASSGSTRKADFTLVAEYDGEPNGLKIHRDGRIFIADYKNGIVVLDPETGKVDPFLARVRLERLKAVNDLVFASNGDMYFTDQGLTGLHDPTGRVFRVRADGRVDCLLDNIPSPNGIVLDPSETVLYVAVTRANAIWRVPLMRDGTVAKVGNFIQLSGGGGPDGLAMDEAGNLCVAHIGIGAVWLFSPAGEPLLRLQSRHGRHTTNMAFGGPDRRTLFITESETGTILRAEMDVPGRQMFSHG